MLFQENQRGLSQTLVFATFSSSYGMAGEQHGQPRFVNTLAQHASGTASPGNSTDMWLISQATGDNITAPVTYRTPLTLVLRLKADQSKLETLRYSRHSTLIAGRFQSPTSTSFRSGASSTNTWSAPTPSTSSRTSESDRVATEPLDAQRDSSFQWLAPEGVRLHRRAAGKGDPERQCRGCLPAGVPRQLHRLQLRPRDPDSRRPVPPPLLH